MKAKYHDVTQLAIIDICVFIEILQGYLPVDMDDFISLLLVLSILLFFHPQCQFDITMLTVYAGK